MSTIEPPRMPDLPPETVQRFERQNAPDEPIHCIYCGQKVFFRENGDLHGDPCKHTMFIAHEEGWEYISESTAAQLRNKGFSATSGEKPTVQALEPDDGRSIDQISDEFEAADGLKIVNYMYIPGGIRSYVGFGYVEE